MCLPLESVAAAGKPAAAAGGTTGRRKSIKKKGKDGKKLELAQVIAPYEATSKEQLSLVQVNKKIQLKMRSIFVLDDKVSIQKPLYAVEVLYLI